MALLAPAREPREVLGTRLESIPEPKKEEVLSSREGIKKKEPSREGQVTVLDKNAPKTMK